MVNYCHRLDANNTSRVTSLSPNSPSPIIRYKLCLVFLACISPIDGGYIYPHSLGETLHVRCFMPFFVRSCDHSRIVYLFMPLMVLPRIISLGTVEHCFIYFPIEKPQLNQSNMLVSASALWFALQPPVNNSIPPASGFYRSVWTLFPFRSLRYC